MVYYCTPPLLQYINYVSRLPDSTLEESGAIVAADLWDEDTLEDLQDERIRFWAIGQWLLHYRFDEPLPTELLKPQYSIYIPMADFANARLELAQRLYHKSFPTQFYFVSGGQLWSYVEASDFLGSIALRGLGEKLKIPELSRKPLLIGKTAWLSGKKVPQDNEPSMVGGRTTTWFDQEAQKIAQDDPYFREHYSDYLRAFRRYRRKLKENPEYQITYHLPDGTTYRTAKGQKFPQSRGKPFGFGKKHCKEM